MSDLRVFAQQIDDNWGNDAGWRAVRGLRDGTLSVADFKQVMLLAGNMYGITVGAFSTPVAGGGVSAVIDIDRPQATVAVPSGTAILPTLVAVQCQMPLLAADNDEQEILVGVDRNVAAVTAAATSETPVNLLIEATNSRTSGVTAASIHSTNITVAPVVDIELARRVLVGDVQGTAANALWGRLELDWRPAPMPAIVGPATLLVYWGGTTAMSGFAQVQWIELASSRLT